MRSGGIATGHSTGTTWDLGSAGYFWSLTTASKIQEKPGLGAYRLIFYQTSANPSFGPDRRWYAFPLHCLSLLLLYTSCAAGICKFELGIPGMLAKAVITGHHPLRQNYIMAKAL